jgi:hypothetical protein
VFGVVITTPQVGPAAGCYLAQDSWFENCASTTSGGAVFADSVMSLRLIRCGFVNCVTSVGQSTTEGRGGGAFFVWATVEVLVKGVCAVNCRTTFAGTGTYPVAGQFAYIDKDGPGSIDFEQG